MRGVKAGLPQRFVDAKTCPHLPNDDFPGGLAPPRPADAAADGRGRSPDDRRLHYRRRA